MGVAVRRHELAPVGVLAQETPTRFPRPATPPKNIGGPRGMTPEEILAAEAPDWKLVWIASGGGLCVKNHKEIWLDEKNSKSLGMLLHEIAHIKHQKHDVHFADCFTALVDKYTKCRFCLISKAPIYLFLIIICAIPYNLSIYALGYNCVNSMK